MASLRTYSDLHRFETFEERYAYLNLKGHVGEATFGFDRWINQTFYRSREWKRARHHVIARDLGCDLGIEGREIHDMVLIHHMNPITAEELVHHDLNVIDPEFLITTTKQTHNAIHFGDASLLRTPYVERRPGDTRLWRNTS